MDDRLAFLARKPWLPLWVTLILLIGLGGLSLWQWQALERREHEQRQQRFEQEAQDISQRVVSRMQAYDGPARHLWADDGQRACVRRGVGTGA